MNILHILSRRDSYDAVHTALDLSRHLSANNHNSTVASSLDENILRGISKNLQYHKIAPFETDIRGFFVSYRILKELIKSSNIDVIHIHSMSSVWLASLLCRNTGARLAISCYNFQARSILNHGFVLVDKIIVHNEAVGKQTVNNFRLSSQKVKYISPVLDIENFNFHGIDERSKTDFSVGVIPSLTPDSGYEYFLKAMVKVVRIIPYVNVSVLVSPSHSRKNIKEDLAFWTRRLGLSSYVKFIDTSNLDLKFISKFNLLIYAPIIENALTRIVLEAQAYGVPVIAGHVAGISQLISDNKTGVFIPPRDNSFLANAIIKVLKEFSFTREIALAARKRIEEEFCIDKNINAFIDTYGELKNKKNILVVNLGNANDVVSTVPALNLLRKNMPEAEITVLIASDLRCLLQRCPYVNELVTYDILKRKSLSYFVKIVRLIIEKRFDMVFDFGNNFKSHLISFLSLARNRYGYRNRIFGFLINNHLERPVLSGGLTEDKLSILGLLSKDAGSYKLELWPSQEEVDFIDGFFQANWIGKEKVAVIDASLKRGFFIQKKTIVCLAYLCNSLAKQNMRIVLVGSKDNTRVKEALFKKVNPRPISFISDISPLQLACLMGKSHIYISFCPDFSYIAATMKTPSLIISIGNNLDTIESLKNVTALSLEDFPIGKNRIYKKKNTQDAQGRDVVLQAINRLIEAK